MRLVRLNKNHRTIEIGVLCRAEEARELNFSRELTTFHCNDPAREWQFPDVPATVIFDRFSESRLAFDVSCAAKRPSPSSSCAYRFAVVLEEKMVGLVDIDGIGEGEGTLGY
jgi:hypothetical protein